MTKGFDCATPLTTVSAAAFAAAGYKFVCRYLVPGGWKALTRPEAEAISGAGLQIVSVFETTADRALGGHAAGLADGAAAQQVAQRIGQPQGSAIYFAVDFDATTAQMSAVIEYIRAAAEATPLYATGVYGSFEVVEAVKAAGACSRFWQTYAWSRGVKSAGVHLYQYQNDVTLFGVGVDLNESYGNEGWWNTQEMPPVPNLISTEDANKIIGFLAAGYASTDDPAGRQDFHRLANELRKASGQPVE